MHRKCTCLLWAAVMLAGPATAADGLKDLALDVMESGEAPHEATARIRLPAPPNPNLQPNGPKAPLQGPRPSAELGEYRQTGSGSSGFFVAPPSGLPGEQPPPVSDRPETPEEVADNAQDAANEENSDPGAQDGDHDEGDNQDRDDDDGDHDRDDGDQDDRDRDNDDHGNRDQDDRDRDNDDHGNHDRDDGDRDRDRDDRDDEERGGGNDDDDRDQDRDRDDDDGDG